jgi:inosose dehydratase
MSIRLGINPLTWSNDDLPSLGGDTPLETCLREARAAGYEGIELGNKFPRNAAELRPFLERHGLALISGWYSSFLLERSIDDEIAAVEAHLQLLSDMDCDVMVFAECTGCVHGQQETPVSQRPALADNQWQAFGGKLTAVAEHLAARGVAMAYHHHMGTVIESETDIDRLMDVTGPAVGLLLDAGHMTYAGGDPHAVLDRHAARINHVHCKDVRRPVLDRVKAADSSFLSAVLAGVFTVPGDGCVDFKRLCTGLKQHDYSGWLVVEAEQDPEIAPPLKYARMGHMGLTGAVLSAGY